MNTGGQRLRALRESLGLTMRDVEAASGLIADKHQNGEFAIPPSRLSDIETKNVVPSIYRIYSLAVIYRENPHELMSLFGVNLDEITSDLALAQPPKSHVSEASRASLMARMPVRLDPSFDTRFTANVGRVIEQWGLVPLSYLTQFMDRNYTYGYVGSEDFTMYPILPPGTFIQVDETKNFVTEGIWRSEYERPIYFVETRDGYACSWCALQEDSLVLQPHPLSPVAVRVLKHPQEAEIVGQVVGVAMRLGEWSSAESLANSKERRVLH